MHPYWPLFDLEVHTPTLTLRGIDDALGVELCDLMQRGIHEPGFMPFVNAWSSAPSPQRERDAFRFWWRSRAENGPGTVHLGFAVIHEATVIGAGGLDGPAFGKLRTVETGSWLGQAYQGKGLGKEFRAALLHLAFAGLGAVEATTGAFANNAPSLGVTRSLGYEPNGVFRAMQGDHVGEICRFRISRERWEAIRRDDIELVNIEPAREFLGLTD